MTKARKGQIGVCKLTGNVGPFVKSHLIPRALTPPRSDGEGFPQLGMGQRPSRRFDSWYDLALVTQAGEDILTEYDTFAIVELRRLKLIWQSWGPMLALSTTDWNAIPGSPNGMRRVIFNDAPKMRLFFLSLLWRAVESSRVEFAAVKLRPSDARRLRAAIRDGNTDLPDGFFPVTLTQMSTMGLAHNFGPVADIKQPVTIEGYTSKAQPIYRFYFDGLAIHIHTAADSEAIDALQPDACRTCGRYNAVIGNLGIFLAGA